MKWDWLILKENKYVGTVELDSDEDTEIQLVKAKTQKNEFINKVMKRRGTVILRSDQTDLPGPDTLTATFKQLSDEPNDQSE